MAVTLEEQRPAPPGEIRSSKEAQGSGSSDNLAQGPTTDGKSIDQALVIRAADGSGVELGAGKSSSSAGEGESAGTIVSVVSESGPESHGNSTSAGGSRQIPHISLTLSSSPPLLPDSTNGNLEAGKKIIDDGDSDDVDLEKGLNPPAAAAERIDKNGGMKTEPGYEAGEEPVCRVCQFSLGPSKETLMNLGCSCKRDLAHAHRECAETWFRVRGNRNCEICGEVARNVHLAEAPAGTSTGDTTTITVVTVHHRYTCQNRPVRVLLGFLVAAFLVPWLFRFAYKQ